MKTVFSILIFFSAIIALLAVYTGSQNQNAISVTIPIQLPNQNPQAPTVCKDTSFFAQLFLFLNFEPCNEPISSIVIPPEKQSNVVTSGDILVISIAIAGGFLALGLLAGLGGAGQLANIISAVGIGIAFITGTNLTISQAFTGVPIVIYGFLNSIFVVMFSYIILRLLK